MPYTPRDKELVERIAASQPLTIFQYGAGGLEQGQSRWETVTHEHPVYRVPALYIGHLYGTRDIVLIDGIETEACIRHATECHSLFVIVNGGRRAAYPGAFDGYRWTAHIADNLIIASRFALPETMRHLLEEFDLRDIDVILSKSRLIRYCSALSWTVWRIWCYVHRNSTHSPCNSPTFPQRKNPSLSLMQSKNSVTRFRRMLTAWKSRYWWNS